MGFLSFFDLRKYTDKGYNVFIETGTGSGAGIQYAKAFPFKKLFSIEIETSLFLKAKHLMDDRTTLLNMDSVSGLKEAFKNLDVEDKVVFWLDAHFPGVDCGIRSVSNLVDFPEGKNFPLQEELNLIYARGAKDCLLIDDLRILEDGSYEWGGITDEFRNQLRVKKWDKIQDMFPQHKVERVYKQHGFLILEPAIL